MRIVAYIVLLYLALAGLQISIFLQVLCLPKDFSGQADQVVLVSD